MASRSVSEQSSTVYSWQVPGTQVTADLDLNLIDSLAAEVMKGYALVPKRGAEVGGLLLGRVESGVAPVVQVLNFTAVLIKYQKGPSYRLSDQDRAQFASRLREIEGGTESDLRVVGLYRSHTRENFCLTEEDAALFEEHCSSPESVFLLIRPSASRIPEAALLCRENGELPRTPPTQVFPFRRKSLERLINDDSPARPLKADEGLHTLPSGNARQEDDEWEIRARLPFASITAHQAVSPPPSFEPPPAELLSPVKYPWSHERPLQQLVPLAPPQPASGSGQPKAEDPELDQKIYVPLAERGDAWQQARASSLAALDYAALARERRRRWLAGSVIAILFLLVGAVGGMEVASHWASPSTLR